MNCKECGSKYVVNKTYKLCTSCNNIRLHGSPFKKQAKIKVKPKDKSLMDLKNSIAKEAMEINEYFCKGCGNNKVFLERALTIL